MGARPGDGDQPGRLTDVSRSQRPRPRWRSAAAVTLAQRRRRHTGAAPPPSHWRSAAAVTLAQRRRRRHTLTMHDPVDRLARDDRHSVPAAAVID